MRKVLKTRTQFPAGKPANERTGAPRLIEGHITQGWHEAWGEMVTRWPERFTGRL